MKVQYRLCSYHIHSMWNALQSCRHLFGSKKTYSRTLTEIHSDGEFRSKFQDVHTHRQEFQLVKSLISLQNVQKHFQMLKWKGYDWLRNWKQTHTRTRPKVAFCIPYLLLRCGLDFLTELFSKNVTFGARVCPPLGAGE